VVEELRARPGVAELGPELTALTGGEVEYALFEERLGLFKEVRAGDRAAALSTA
jgi:hypothetical protein